MKQNITQQPLISVVMPVYNAAAFLPIAIESIQNQTFTNWEMFCFDDLSTDNSWQILQDYAKKDSRIKVFRNGHHRGVAGAANEALKKAKGSFIARMDADDVALPYRFQVQVDYLTNNPSMVAVGGQCEVIDQSGQVIGEKRFPTDPKKTREMIFATIPLQQPTLMVHRGRLPKSFAWYKEGAQTAEEVDVLFRLLQAGEVTNVSETVLRYRIHGNNVSLKDPKKTFYITLKARLRAVREYGYQPTITGWITTLAQAIVVTVLPSGWVYPVYAVLRGMSKFGEKRLVEPVAAILKVE
jgi:glycosyltransferase involved in cell wall biosynthesis